MRGDRPELLPAKGTYYMFTPHARGSTDLRITLQVLLNVYPACAGIDLMIDCLQAVMYSLPRMRGDRPLSFFALVNLAWFTPHARGSDRIKMREIPRKIMFTPHARDRP